MYFVALCWDKIWYRSSWPQTFYVTYTNLILLSVGILVKPHCACLYCVFWQRNPVKWIIDKIAQLILTYTWRGTGLMSYNLLWSSSYFILEEKGWSVILLQVREEVYLCAPVPICGRYHLAHLSNPQELVNMYLLEYLGMVYRQQTAYVWSQVSPWFSQWAFSFSKD